ncbi:MAG TPA: hypothetical protein DEP46_00480 [Blastocatellia bacterium]|nr:hypothetical protein [Blastocatellia bacterium]
MRFLSADDVISVVREAIQDRLVLSVRYQHTDEKEIVEHKIAPFDIGSTNPKTERQTQNNLYAYSYTRISSNTNLPDPRVVAFNINNFLEIKPTGENFDEVELSKKNFNVTGYDYRYCRFALLPNRDWY